MAKKKQTGYTVIVAFKDSKNYSDGNLRNSYELGADVSDLEADRLAKLVERGIVSKPQEQNEE